MSRSFIFLFFLVASIALDEAIKVLVRKNFVIGESVKIVGDFFKITYIENRGIAFSFMEDNPIFLYALPIAMMMVLAYMYGTNRKYYGKSFDIGCALCLGGGTANLIDRIIFSMVTDYVHIGSFAIFNLADVFINIGIGLICLNIMFLKGKA